MATPTYTLIDSTTLTSSASTITFSSIPQTYRDLVLVAQFETSAAAVPNMQFNLDTGSNYYYVYATGNGSSATSSSGNTSSLSFNQEIFANTATPYLATVQLLDFSATDKHKSILIRANNQQEPVTGLVGAGMQAGRWANTSAITSILIRTGGGNFEIGSTFSLYGIAA